MSKRGRNRVLVGDLDYAGVTGKVYTPAEGQSLPAVAFGHDWLHKIKDYHATLRHLASWGIVVVAPDSETGPFPNHRNLAADMESALQIAAGVKLGAGNITVSPGKLGMIGHGMGGGTAVLGALDNQKVAAVAAIYPSVTAPSAVQAARRITTPGLVIGAGQEDIFNAGNPAKLAHNWNGPVCFRAIDKGSHAGFTEDRLRKLAIGTAAFQSGPTEIARGLVTGFLLATLNGDSTYAAFADPEASAKKVTSLVGEDLAERAGVTRDA